MSSLSRRQFIARTLATSSTAALYASRTLPGLAADTFSPPIVVFSKVYQTLKLDFVQAAAVTAEAGLAGVDCPVRPFGSAPATLK